MDQANPEQTLVLIKPDALKNSLLGYVLSQLSEFHTGLRFAAMKVVQVSQMLAEEHYAEHRGKVFYHPLIQYIRGSIHNPTEPGMRRVIALVHMGMNAIQKVREIAGPTNPHVAREQRPGCIRALGTVVPIRDASGAIIGERLDNLIHASANAAEAEREIKLWFRPVDIPSPMRVFPTEICQEHFYFRSKRLYSHYEPGSVCLLAPGDAVWRSDLEALQALIRELPAPCAVETVAAKYLINEDREND